MAKQFASTGQRSPKTPFFRRRQLQALLLYALLQATTLGVALLAPGGSAERAFLVGLSMPGAGFLQWAAGDQAMFAVLCFASGLCAFGIAGILWFATGNLLAPVTTWIAVAWLAGQPERVALGADASIHHWHLLVAPLVLSGLALAWLRADRASVSRPVYVARMRSVAERSTPAGELAPEDLQRLRLLLDRALQPEDRFEGFEWRDQFQTAAVRYQVSFMAYALALAQHHYAPAADACFLDAQRRLLTKIGDHRLWRYWVWENAWGNLRAGADPIPHQNIMYSGFTALQMALAGSDELVLRRDGRTWRRHELRHIAQLLARQYQASPYGLLACEPNWIYPLCNLITMTGTRAADARLGTQWWDQLSEGFIESLQREAMRPDGRFIGFRSTITGVAPPTPGGIVMQAFPCLFLNGLCPELAQRQWQGVRERLEAEPWERLFWPIDVGNYGFSRASSYAATAAAAVEMGDRQIATECLARLETSCPSRSDRGVIHRDHASLWAHSLELAARFSRKDGLRHLTEHHPADAGPRLASAQYPQVLIAAARAREGTLQLVLHPGGTCRAPQIELDGLLPDRTYQTGQEGEPFFRADHAGHASLRVPVQGRTRLTIRPVR